MGFGDIAIRMGLLEGVMFKLTNHAKRQWKNILGNRNRKCRVSVAERCG